MQAVDPSILLKFQQYPVAQQRKKCLVCVSTICYPFAILKMGCLSIKCCCRVVTESRQPLCAMQFFSRQECWDGERPFNSRLDAASRVINPCVCCIDWSSLPADYFLFEDEMGPKRVLMDEDSSTDGPAPSMYPKCCLLPGLGGGEALRTV